MNYLAAVNSILVTDGVIRGDDDAITSFSDTQHVANIRWAKEAVKQELNALRAHHQWEGNRQGATLITAAGTRTYDLSDPGSNIGAFVRFDETTPWLLKVSAVGESEGRRVTEYPGGLGSLRRNILTYLEQAGDPVYWYYDQTDHVEAGLPPTLYNEKRIGLYPVPDAVYYYTFNFVSDFFGFDTSSATETSTLPFAQEWEAEVFVQACVERFKYLRLPLDQRNVLYPNGLVRHPALLEAESTLMALLNPKPMRMSYGRRFVG